MSVAKSFNTRPLYQQVADEFISRIVTRVWAPGQAIENETEIARSLGISLGTVRKAFDILTDHELLERQQGKGTVVADLDSGRARSRFSNLFDGEGRRVTGELTVGDVRLDLPSPEVAGALEINGRTPVLHFERRRSHMGRLFMTEAVFLRVHASAQTMNPAELENLAADRWRGQDLATHKSEAVRTETASERDAEVFGISRLASVLVLARVIYSYQNKPLELRHGRCHLGADLFYQAR